MGARKYIATLVLLMIIGLDGHAAETSTASTLPGRLLESHPLRTYWWTNLAIGE